MSSLLRQIKSYLHPKPKVQREREHERNRPSLVAAGRHAGDSRVAYRGRNLPLHLLTRDFFITVVTLDTLLLLSLVAGIYLSVFLIWSFLWWLIVQFYPTCLYGADTYVDAFAFSIVTQMTIGYGNTGPQSCWAATWMICFQSIFGVLLEAITLGIVFARISHPAQRARSIFISEKAVIARRDGLLKFMFRVADIRSTQVVEPKVKAYLYTWGEGRITAEGERIPVRVEPLDVDYIDGMLLLPLIIEHTIDERSPLCGHTLTSLLALNAEIIVTFEGTTEMGNPFMARRSYIPTDLYWGHQFVNILLLPQPGEDQYGVALERFDDVELQNEMPMLLPTQLSQLVVNRAKRTVPYPLLGENTLVLSDVLCVAPNAAGNMCLTCRVGDTYPNQMLELTARMYLYRWRDTQPERNEGFEAYEQIPLQCGYKDGTDRLYLRLPVEVVHVIDDDSPLASWRDSRGLSGDANSEIVVVVNAYLHVTGGNRLRQRTYAVDHHVRYGYRFKPVVKPPQFARDKKPRVRWQHFHDVIPSLEMDDEQRANALKPDATAQMLANVFKGPLSAAPESHSYLTSIASMKQRAPFALRAKSEAYLPGLTDEARNDFTVAATDLQRYAAAVGGDGEEESPTAAQAAAAAGPSSRLQSVDESEDIASSSSQLFSLFPDLKKFASDTVEATDSLPHAAALHPSLPGPDKFRMSEDDERNDYTVVGMDLSRYAATMGDDDTYPPVRRQTYTPLPGNFGASEETAEQSPQIQRQESVSTSVVQQDQQAPEGEVEEEMAGPIHVFTQPTWVKGRALRNVFTTDEEPSKDQEHDAEHKDKAVGKDDEK